MTMRTEMKRFPLTNVQWAYLLGRNKNYESGGVSTHVYYELKNNLDIKKFEIALNKVIKRHSMLRTVIEESGEHRVIDNYNYYEVSKKDLSLLNYTKQQDFIRNRRDELSHYVYNPSVWPLFTIETLILNKEKTDIYMFISIDMLIADASSLTLMFSEILEFYINPNLEKPLPDKNFSDYIEYIEKIKTTDKYKKDKDYWLDKVNEIPLAPILPSINQKENVNSIFKRMRHEFCKNDWKNIKEILSQNRIISTSFLCTCYAEVLAHWSGEDNFSLNFTLSNRGKLSGCNNVIGDFTSLMLLPIEIKKEDKTFLEKIKTVQKTFIESYSHSLYDGVELIREVIKSHNMQKQVAFPIVFTSLPEVYTGNENSPNLFGEIQYSLSQTPQVYLDCQVHEEDNKLIVSWDYLDSKYDQKMMEEMFSQFIKLIELTGSQNWDKYDNIFALSNDSVKKRIDYNNTYKDFPKLTLQSIIKESCHKYKNKIAVVDGENKYTYEEIDKHSKKYAIYLKSKGIKKGDFVCVKGYKEAETIFKILGIIKIGAAYVPINPDFPQQRVQYVLSNCGCKYYLEENIELSQNDSELVFDDAKADISDTAYVIYTSGSTGKPKGVVINNQAVCNTLFDINERFDINSSDRILCVSSFGFDLSVYDVFGAILAGACVVLTKDSKDIIEINNVLIKEKITVWNSVPAILELLIDCINDEENIILKNIFLSGDFIPINLVSKIKKVFPKANLISLGGATEGSIWSIFYKVDYLNSEWNTIPYGYPLANQTCYILDKELNQCPDEVIGEICIGGKGVADGYINNIEQTNSNFINHKLFGKLYKTGDMGVFMKDGYINILGRVGQQTKINGYRIEVGEIAKTIEESEFVKKAFVDIQNNDNKNKIVSYIVPDKQKNTDIILKDNIIKVSQTISEQIPEELCDGVSKEIEDQMNYISFENIKATLAEFIQLNDIPKEISVNDFINYCGIKKIYFKVIVKWFDVLCEHNILQKKQDKYLFFSFSAHSKYEIKNMFDKIIEKYATHMLFKNNEYKKSFNFLKQCMLLTKEILTGEKLIIDILFEKGKLEIANNLYKESPSAKYFNRIIYKTILEYIPFEKAEKVNILELGAGTGGASFELLKRLNNKNVEFTFTDISNFFLENAKAEFSKYNFVKYGIYDIDKAPQEQGYSLETYDVILAANVIHDGKDIFKSLSNIYDLLKPNGMLVLLEITKESYLYLTTFELLEGYASYNDFRLEKNSALLDKDSWVYWLKKVGFVDTSYYPSSNSKLSEYGENVIIAFKNNTSCYLDNSEMYILKQELEQKLTQYMLPNIYVQLKEIPLSNNGKVDKSKLPKVNNLNEKYNFIPPKNKIEKDIYKYWCELLKHSKFGIEDNFFEIGGDSLLMIKFITNVNKIYNIKIQIKDFIQNPIIKDISNYIRLNNNL